MIVSVKEWAKMTNKERHEKMLKWYNHGIITEEEVSELIHLTVVCNRNKNK